MPQQLLLGKPVEYIIRRSLRARHLRISIDWEKGLIVTLPIRMEELQIEPFLVQKASWILKHLQKRATLLQKTPIRVSKQEYFKLKTDAIQLLTEQVGFFNRFYKFTYNKISVRNQKTIWGSCTRSGNLQFNYKLILLPRKYLNYVVVHELCHLQEHNHSPKFWTLVSKMIPDHKLIRKELRKFIMLVS